jgi:hypothetical protein
VKQGKVKIPIMSIAVSRTSNDITSDKRSLLLSQRKNMDKPFQRKGSTSNAQVGRDFEKVAQLFFAEQGLHLNFGVSIKLRINDSEPKPHKFDLGSVSQKVLVECKAHTWTEGGNVPSAKLTVWNEAMFFFHAAPSGYRKILFVLHHFSDKKNITLGGYYTKTNSHLIPDDVEIWECEEHKRIAKRIK